MIMLIVVFVALIAIAAIPSLRVLVGTVIYVALTVASTHYPAVAGAAGSAIDTAKQWYRKVLWMAVGYSLLLVGIATLCVIFIYFELNVYLAATVLTFVLALWPIQKALLWVSERTNEFKTVLRPEVGDSSLVLFLKRLIPAPPTVSEPKMITLLMVLPIYATITAVTFPNFFYHSYGFFLILFLLIGIQFIVAFNSKVFWAAKIFTGLTVTTAILGVLVLITQVTVSAYQQGVTFQNWFAQLHNRPEHKLKTETLAWTLAVYQSGTVVEDQYGFAKVEPCLDATGQQIRYPAGQSFKTLNLRTFVDAGEALVQIFPANSDGSWLNTQEKRPCWIPVSKTDVPELKPNPSPSMESVKVEKVEQSAPQTKVETPKSEEIPKSVDTSFTVPANAVYASGIYVKKGQEIIVRATGKVNSLPETKYYDGTYKWVGPEGWGTLDPRFISEGKKSLAGPLPQGRSYMALTARIGTSQPSLTDGNWTIIGRGLRFTADQDGMLYFVVNEKLSENGTVRTEWLENNQGGFKVEVKVR